MALASRTALCLRFSGDDLVPERISEALQCRPTRSAAKGGPWLLPDGSPRVAATGRLHLSVDRRLPATSTGRSPSFSRP